MGLEEMYIDPMEFEDLCIYTVILQNPHSTTFADVKFGDKLYDCTTCPGTPGSCPNYASYKSLYDSQYTKFRRDIGD